MVMKQEEAKVFISKKLGKAFTPRASFLSVTTGFVQLKSIETLGYVENKTRINTAFSAYNFLKKIAKKC